MEFDQLGARCFVSDCGQLDFLPFRCEACGETTCLEHRKYDAHGCTARREGVSVVTARVADCPVCQQPVTWGPKENPNHVMANHIDAGCPKRKRQNEMCGFASCSVRDAVPVKCKKCLKAYCLRHRSELDHGCRRAEQKNARDQVAQRKTPVSDSLFANSELTPIGNNKLEAGDRFPLAVFFPVGSSQKPTFMFFHRKHTVGRVLDEIAERFEGVIPPSPVGSARLQLFPVGAQFQRVQAAPHMTPLCNLEALNLLDPVIIDYDISPDHLSTCRASFQSEQGSTTALTWPLRRLLVK